MNPKLEALTNLSFFDTKDGRRVELTKEEIALAAYRMGVEDMANKVDPHFYYNSSRSLLIAMKNELLNQEPTDEATKG